MAELKKFEFSSEDACCKLQWLNKPKKINFTGSKLIITPDVNTDFWQKTYYNPELIADNGHFLYQEVQDKTMVETRFNIESGAQFDQAGLMVRKDNKCWIKTGIEFVDGANTLGCVVTNVYSDWSTQPINLQKLSIRVYRQGASFVVEAKTDETDWHFIRICHLNIDAMEPIKMGLYTCKPKDMGEGKVTFDYVKYEKVDKFHHNVD